MLERLEKASDDLSQELYGMRRHEAFEQRMCVRCKKAPVFTTDLGYSEYLISGLCEPCFDEITKEPEESEMEIKQSIPKDEASYDFETIKSERAFDQARTLGQTVVLPKPNELQLDIDTVEAWGNYNRNFEKFDTHIIPIDEVKVEPSRSGEEGKYHVTLTLAEDISAKNRILYQLLLGSDPVREMLSLIRYVNEDPHPTLFIEKAPLLLKS